MLRILIGVKGLKGPQLRPPPQISRKKGAPEALGLNSPLGDMLDFHQK